MEEQHEKLMARAKARKQRMMELEAEKKKNLPMTEFELEDHLRKSAIIDRVKVLFCV